MKKCKFCRSEYSGSTCPNCGASGGKEIIDKISNYSNNGISENDIKNFLNGDNGNIIYKAQSIARTIRIVFKTWIICIILGFILSYFMKKGDIVFIEENMEILEYVKNGLFFFGWFIGIIISKIRKFV